jgi:Zn-dependent peptidase ImmA (M78 family)
MPPKLVPATPSVIAWAIQESGFSLRALATLLDVPQGEIEGWTKGKHPELAKLQALAAALKRPFSAFLLPHPPASSIPSVKFRSSTAATARELNPEERRSIREAARLQQVISWLTRELEIPGPEVPFASTKSDIDDMAQAIRARLNVSLETQLSWSSATEALRAWREAVERLGVLVLMLPMGEESCRGFSIWDDAAPLIAINTAWLPEARVFTLFHELAHLATRTNSACAEDAAPRSTAGDRIERWCERVAAAVLVPADGLSKVLSKISKDATTWTADLSAATQIASTFRVSRRAAALRLIESERATWGLFKSIPPHTDRLSRRGGGRGRTRAEIRRQRYGERTMALFREALTRDVLGPADVIDYLDVSPDTVVSSLPYPSGGEDE